jgi:membrane protein
MAFAGNLTYNAFLSLFPFLLFLVSILKLVDATGLITALVGVMAHSLPAPAAYLVRHQILPDVMSRLTDNPFLSVLLALGSLWQVTFVGRAIVQALNRMYGTEDKRSAWRRFLLPLVFALGAAIFFLAALALLVFGSQIGVIVGGRLGSGTAGWWASAILRWPLLLVLAFLAFAVIYYWGPDVDQRAPFVSTGAALATIAWLIFSVAFSLVLNQFAVFLVSPLYGWFTGLIILLMYLYWSSVIILIGAEINRVVEDQTPESRSES